MKYLKIAAITLLVAAIVAVAVAYLRRDSVAREIANSILEGRDITVTRLSVRSLQTERVEFADILLQLADGTEIDISGLSFPLSFPSVRPEHVSIETLSVKPAEGDGKPVPYDETLRTLLDLPDSMPGTAVTIERLAFADMPAVTDIVWAVADRMQRLTFTVQSATGGVELERSENGNHRATFLASVAGDDDFLTLDVEIVPGPDGFTAGGRTKVGTAALLTTLESLEILPRNTLSLDAELEGSIEFRLADAGPATAQATLFPGEQSTLRYRAGEDLPTEARVTEAEAVDLSIELPSLEWSASMQTLGILLDAGPVSDLPVQISRLECRSGGTCAADLRVAANGLQLQDAAIGDLELAASLQVTGGETFVVRVAEGLLLNLRDLEIGALSVDSIQVSGFTGATISIDDESWRADVDDIGFNVDNAAVGEQLVATLPVSLRNLRAGSADYSLAAELSVTPGLGTLRSDGIGLVMPGIEGEIEWRANTISSVFDVPDAGDGTSARIEASHDTEDGRGGVYLRKASLHFDRQNLSEHTLDWPYDWNLVAGTWAASARLLWSNDGYTGSMNHELREIAGNYGDIAFTGLGGSASLDVDSSPSLAVSAAAINIAMLDVGLPLENVSARFSLDDRRTLQVDTLSTSALGGEITVDPFRYDAGAPENLLLVRPQSVQLQFMAALAGFEAIELSGSLSGTLPVSVRGNTVTITDGMLENDPPGGTIRYGSGTAADAAAAETGLDIATRALTNFEFNSLTSDVDYSEDGDLTLQMRLTGVNPDYDASQPINLNLGVENNIPELLRSLQAIRSIEDVLERGTQN